MTTRVGRRLDWLPGCLRPFKGWVTSRALGSTVTLTLADTCALSARGRIQACSNSFKSRHSVLTRAGNKKKATCASVRSLLIYLSRDVIAPSVVGRRFPGCNRASWLHMGSWIKLPFFKYMMVLSVYTVRQWGFYYTFTFYKMLLLKELKCITQINIEICIFSHSYSGNTTYVTWPKV